MQLYKIITNISSIKKAGIVLNLLPHYFKIKEITFNQEQKKGVFEIKAAHLPKDKITELMNDLGYRCHIK